MSAKDHTFSGSRSGRFLKVTALASKVSSSYFGQKVKALFVSDESARASLAETHLLNAARLTKTFGELKGALMKVGQMLSLYKDILPAEYTGLLANLQRSAPPLPFERLRTEIETELGRGLNEVFAEVDPAPHAAASIGQVHRARLHGGREVVLKIQYPGIDQTVESDLKNLRLLLRSLGLLKRERGIEELIAEVQARLLEELDYRHELQNLERFREAFQDDPRVVIPRPHSELSTARLLVMDLVAGQDLRTAAVEADQARRDALGRTLIDLYCRQVLRLGALHADPNPANFAVLPDGRLGFFDFGCVRYYPEDFLARYRTLLEDPLHGRYDTLDVNMAAIGVVPLDGGFNEPRLFRLFAEPVLEPFLTEEYDFSGTRIHERLIKLGLEHWQDGLKMRAPPEVIFLDRVVVGMYNNLRALRARGRFREIILKYL